MFGRNLHQTTLNDSLKHHILHYETHEETFFRKLANLP